MAAGQGTYLPWPGKVLAGVKWGKVGRCRAPLFTEQVSLRFCNSDHKLKKKSKASIRYGVFCA